MNRQGEYNQAITNYEKGYSVAYAAKDTVMLSNLYNNMANTYTNMGNFDYALISYQNSIKEPVETDVQINNQ